MVIARALTARHAGSSTSRDGVDNLIEVSAPELAATLSSGSHPGSAMPGRHQEDDANLVVANTLTAHRGKGGGGISPEETFVPVPAEAYVFDPDDTVNGRGAIKPKRVDQANTLSATSESSKTDRGVRIVQEAQVRRLTPTECERLMGWPDGWTAPPGVKAPDSRRYHACGDGVVANVAEWIGRRIMAVEESVTDA